MFVVIADTAIFPDGKVHGDNVGPTCGRQDPGGPHVGPMNFAIWVGTLPSSQVTTTHLKIGYP